MPKKLENRKKVSREKNFALQKPLRATNWAIEIRWPLPKSPAVERP
jgi:hypothetical protein